MNPSQIEKIKQLIRVSPLLNNHERAEWFSFLELMNDKQLLELEKILTSTIPSYTAPASAPVKAALVLKKLVQPAPAPLVPPAPKPVQAPEVPKAQTPLSHIVNFPHINEGAILGQPKPEPVLPKVATAGTNEPTVGFIKFKERLKTFFSEKELPAGNPKPELALPTGQVDKTFMAPMPTSTAARPPAPLNTENVPIVVNMPNVLQVIERTTEQKPNLVSGPGLNIQTNELKMSFPNKTQPIADAQVIVPQKPVAPQVPKGVPITAPLPTKKPAVPLTDTLKTRVVKKPELVKPSIPLSDNTIPLADTSKATIVKKPELVKPILPLSNNTSFPAQVAPRPAAPKIPAPSTMVTPPRHAPASVTITPGIPMMSIEDLRKLNGSLSTDPNTTMTVERIKNLIRTVGYHEVIFNLEKSPLYRAYLNTGSEILQQKTSFENIDKKPTSTFLNREQFEYFIDLLRMIQAS